MKSKIYKILLVVMMFFIGISGVSADDCNMYENFEIAFKAAAAVEQNYYYSAVFDSESQKTNSNSLEDLYKKYFDGVKYTTPYSKTDLENLALVIIGEEGPNYSITAFIRKLLIQVNICGGEISSFTCSDQDYQFGSLTLNSRNFANNLSSYDNLTSVVRAIREQTEEISKKCGTNDKYVAAYDKVYEGYSNFCSYLESHKGVQYYVTMIIRIVTYVSLGLAVILGTLDFIKAITSGDDAALKKAFQTFCKRLAAVVVIFLTYLIVQIFMGLITSIPNYDVSQFEICKDLQVGALNRDTNQNSNSGQQNQNGQ